MTGSLTYGDKNNMTKLYETKAYLTACDTVVTECVTEKDRIYVMLQETIFFPEEGGQHADTGYMEYEGKRVRVLNGRLKQGMVHTEVDEEIPAGTKVHCVLDWEQRYMRMQQHTGEHILTGVIHNRYDFDNVGFHLSDDAPVTLDLNGTLTLEQVLEMETAANEVIYRNLSVTDSYPTKEELEGMTYRSKIEIDGQVRLITIGDVDVCACCAPHVARSGEVGLIKVVNVQNYKGGIRISMLSGKRALLYCREQQSILTTLAAALSTRPENVFSIVNNQKEEIAALRSRLSQLAEKTLMEEIRTLPDSANACLFVSEDMSANAIKNGFNAMAARFSGYVGIFAGDDEHGYRYNAGSTAQDSRELAVKMREKLGAKGGGSREMVQGKTTAKRAEIEAFFALL